MKDKSLEVQTDLGFLRDNLITAIKERRSSTTQDLLEVYKALVKAFVEKLKQLGADYDMATALKESGSIEGGWIEERWLGDDIRLIIDEAFQTEDRNIIFEAIDFAVSLAYIALNEKDYYTYSECLKWIPYSVFRSYSIKDPKVKEASIDRCASQLKGMADYYVGPLLKESKDTKEAERFKELAAGLMLTFKDLLKKTYDNRDYEGFRKFNSCLNQLFEPTSHELTEDSIENQESDIQHYQLTAEELQERQETLEIDKVVYRAWQYINTLRAQLRFGMQSWIVDEYSASKITKENAVRFYKECGDFGNMQELTDLYFQCMQHEVEDLFGWHWWVMEGQHDRVVSFNWDILHSRLYCLKAFELLKGRSLEQAASYEIPERRSLLYRAQNENSTLPTILKEIEENREKWEPLIGPAGIDASSVFRELLKQAVKRQKKTDLEKLINAKIDAGLKEQFKQNFVKGWRETAFLRKLIRTYGGYQDPETAGLAPKGTSRYGYNIMDPKDLYVAESDVSKQGWGSHYGQELGRSESQRVLTDILGKIRRLDEKVPKDRQLDLLDKALEQLKADNYQPNAIVLLNSWIMHRMMMDSGKWKPADASATEGGKLLGYYDDVPIFQTHKQGIRGIVVVLDLKSLGTWKQYQPTQTIAEEEKVDVFTFLLKPYDRESAEQLIEKNPEWLTNSETKALRAKEEAIIEILQRVHLRIFEQFEFIIQDKNAAIRITAGKDW